MFSVLLACYSREMSTTELQQSRLYRLATTSQRRKVPKKYLLQTSEYRRSTMLVRSGYVKRYIISNDGSLGIQAIYGPGYLFPFSWVFKFLFNQEIYSGPEVIYYETMTECDLYLLPSDHIAESAQKDPLIYRDLLLFTGQRFRSNIQWLENRSLPSSYHRVAHQLLFFGEEFGVKENGATRIDVPLTQQDIADTLSATRETVSINISKLKKKKLIKVNHSIIIPSLEKLRLEAYS